MDSSVPWPIEWRRADGSGQKGHCARSVSAAASIPCCGACATPRWRSGSGQPTSAPGGSARQGRGRPTLLITQYRGQAVTIGRPSLHEVGAAAREDPAGEAVAVQQAEQLQHWLVHRRRVGPPEARVAGRGQPAPAGGVELLGAKPGMGERPSTWSWPRCLSRADPRGR